MRLSISSFQHVSDKHEQITEPVKLSAELAGRIVSLKLSKNVWTENTAKTELKVLNIGAIISCSLYISFFDKGWGVMLLL